VRLLLARDVDDAEAVPLRVGEDDVVRVGRSLVPMNLGGTEREQPFDLRRLILGVEVEVDARGNLQAGANAVGPTPSLGRSSTQSSGLSSRRT
jgi:hypothetical protein